MSRISIIRKAKAARLEAKERKAAKQAAFKRSFRIAQLKCEVSISERVLVEIAGKDTVVFKVADVKKILAADKKELKALQAKASGS